MTTTYGMIGLGRMGGNMSRRIARAGLEVVAWDRAAGARSALASEARIRMVETLEALANEHFPLSAPPGEIFPHAVAFLSAAERRLNHETARGTVPAAQAFGGVFEQPLDCLARRRGRESLLEDFITSRLVAVERLLA